MLSKFGIMAFWKNEWKTYLAIGLGNLHMLIIIYKYGNSIRLLEVEVRSRLDRRYL